ncbi:MAG: hypothetical protein ABL986_11270 [Vicinamibacterales bacterium]
MVRNPELERLADACALRLPGALSADAVAAEPSFHVLLNAIRTSDARFTFDREGRPAAIAAVREALPLMERDLFDAVVEDHGCEVAALSEAIFLMTQALSKVQRD